MEEIDLKIYTARAAKLEAAIYTQKKLMVEHDTILLKQKPVAPVIKKPNAPIAPEMPTLLSEKLNIHCIVCAIFLFVIGLPLIAWCLCDLDVAKMDVIDLSLIGVLLLPFVIGIFLIYSARKTKRDNIAANAKRKAEYKTQMAIFAQQKAAYVNDVAYFEMSHAAANAQYQSAISAYTTNCTEIRKQHDIALSRLEASLRDLYAMNVIYPKYRNMVAMTTINEYLMSGRCYELEGPNGAYNLYEMELRQSIVINQLSSIVSNLEQIRDSQFLLYQELTQANATINSILYEIRQVNANTKLTAYFAGVTALIEASPKVTYSRIVSF